MQTPQPRGIDPSAISAIINSKNVVCSCGSKIFKQAFVLKNLSKLVSTTGRDEIIEIPVFVCAKCGEVPDVYKNNLQYKKIMGEIELNVK